jgi:hypothetical protein
MLRDVLLDRQSELPFLLINRETIAFNPHSNFSIDSFDFQRLLGSLPYNTIWSYLTCYQVLQFNHDPRAPGVLEQAYQKLISTAASISDETSRRSYLENVPWHRQIRSLYEQNHPEFTSG